MSDAWQAICDVWSVEPEDHATRSRDYGRGFADAIKRVRSAIEANGITFEEVGSDGSQNDDPECSGRGFCPSCARGSYE
jgi:hypothetical protein